MRLAIFIILLSLCFFSKAQTLKEYPVRYQDSSKVYTLIDDLHFASRLRSYSKSWCNYGQPVDNGYGNYSKGEKGITFNFEFPVDPIDSITVAAKKVPSIKKDSITLDFESLSYYNNKVNNAFQLWKFKIEIPSIELEKIIHPVFAQKITIHKNKVPFTIVVNNRSFQLEQKKDILFTVHTSELMSNITTEESQVFVSFNKLNKLNL